MAEKDREHELALRIVLEGVRREFEVLEKPAIEEPDDLAAVNGVPGKSIGVSGDNSFCVATLNSGEHTVKKRTPWRLGAIVLLNDFDELNRWICAKGALQLR